MSLLSLVSLLWHNCTILRLSYETRPPMHMHANHTELENGGNVIFHTSHTTSELISLGLIGTVSNDCTKSAFGFRRRSWRALWRGSTCGPTLTDCGTLQLATALAGQERRLLSSVD